MLINIEFSGTTKGNREEYEAHGQYDTDKNELVINQGSRWAPTITKKDQAAHQQISEARDKLISDGFVDDTTGIFKKNYTHKSTKDGGTPILSAAGIISGTAREPGSCWTIVGSPEKQLFDQLEILGVIEKKSESAKRSWIEPGKRKPLSPVRVGMESVTQEKENEQEKFLHQNTIFYGVPGCGKSHKINELLNGFLHLDEQVNSSNKKYYKRILFHPEYSYSDFVGQLRPVVRGENITYEFVPGPFTEILREAYKDPTHDYFLIIEEINRGNAPAIFGDLFQLLDRKDGESEYSIYNKDILDYLKDNGICKESIEIPSNLTIFATMNTCDQNVFTLDTAFKRRWRMCRIKNDFDNDTSISDWKINFKDKSNGFLWKEFAEAVNDAILNNCNDGTAAEDKLLGTHFVNENDLGDVRRFAEKVLLYLWDDVAKYDKSQLFDTNNYKTLDKVIDEFVKGKNVFSPNCIKLQDLYKEIERSERTDANKADGSPEEEPSTDSVEKGAPEATDEEQSRE